MGNVTRIRMYQAGRPFASMAALALIAFSLLTSTASAQSPDTGMIPDVDGKDRWACKWVQGDLVCYDTKRSRTWKCEQVAGNWVCRPDTPRREQIPGEQSELEYALATNPTKIPAATAAAARPTVNPGLARSGRNDSCYASMSVTVERDPAATRTVRMDWGDGSSKTYPVPAGYGEMVIPVNHPYYTEDFVWLEWEPGIAYLSHEDFMVKATMVDTGRWGISFVSHEVVAY